MRKRSGGSSFTASPSMPAGTGWSASTSKAGAVHSRHGRCGRVRRRRAGRGSRDRDPEQPVVDPRARAGADRAAEPVAVVRDQDRGSRAVLVPAGPRPAQIEPGRVGSEHLGHGVEQGPQLRVAVALALDRVGVEPERDVVDEHAPVDLGQVDAALAAVDERVERADDVVAIDAEVEREVVACARRHARVRQVELRGDRGDDGLRAVAAGHRQPVGAAGDRVAHEPLEVPRGTELDRLDPARPGFVRHREPLGLAAAGLGVVEQDRPPRRRHPRQVRAEPKAARAQATAQHERGDDQPAPRAGGR